MFEHGVHGQEALLIPRPAQPNDDSMTFLCINPGVMNVKGETVVKHSLTQDTPGPATPGVCGKEKRLVEHKGTNQTMNTRIIGPLQKLELSRASPSTVGKLLRPTEGTVGSRTRALL